MSPTQRCALQVKLEARKHETREILISTITAEAQAAKAAREGPKEIDDVDTDDERDANAEYDSWRIRELQRIRFLPPHQSARIILVLYLGTLWLLTDMQSSTNVPGTSTQQQSLHCLPPYSSDAVARLVMLQPI